MSNSTLDSRVDLGEVYSELAQATERVGADRTPLFLATLTLALLIERGIDTRSLQLIAQAERLAMDEQPGRQQ